MQGMLRVRYMYVLPLLLYSLLKLVNKQQWKLYPHCCELRWNGIANGVQAYQSHWENSLRSFLFMPYE